MDGTIQEFLQLMEWGEEDTQLKQSITSATASESPEEETKTITVLACSKTKSENI